jgi:hypothetical protein
MGLGDRRKCKCCLKLFRPDPRNRRHQYYCSAPDCRAASKAASQARWLAKPENQSYFHGPVNVARVRAWRSRHPGYWRKGRRAGVALQDVSMAQPIGSAITTDAVAGSPLQEFLTAQPAVLIGLIAHMAGTPLQDDIVRTTGRLLRLGQDILATSAARLIAPVPDGGAGRDRLRDVLQNPRLP